MSCLRARRNLAVDRSQPLIEATLEDRPVGSVGTRAATVDEVTDAAGARRRFVYAQHGETIAAIADRVLPGDPGGAEQLMSWNLHLVLRRSPSLSPGQLLGTDIVYLEPPRP